MRGRSGDEVFIYHGLICFPGRDWIGRGSRFQPVAAGAERYSVPAIEAGSRIIGRSDRRHTQDLRKVGLYRAGESGGHAASGHAGTMPSQAETTIGSLREREIREDLRRKVPGPAL